MRCPFCMEENIDGVKFCAHCGKSIEVSNEIHQLRIGSTIGNRYYVGAVIRQGGFGITYVGCDTRLNKKIAIKEYYPSELVARTTDYSQNVSITAGDRTPLYEKEKQRFLSEANILAKFSGEKYIVNVTDVFSEHNTIYMIMEYVEGVDLDDYLRTVQLMDFTSAFNMLKPVIETLTRVHEKGLIHRDISPSNIKVLPDKTPVLLDFGAAREYDVEEEKSYSIILKPGYAPAEQYQCRGVQGPWTDVYAICATLYKMITGITPDNAIDRIVADTLKKPSEVGAKISPEDETVLMKGLEVVQNKRIASMRELCLDFLHESTHGLKETYSKDYVQTELLFSERSTPKETFNTRPKAKSSKGWKKWIIIVGIVAAVSALLVAGLIVIPRVSRNNMYESEFEEDIVEEEDVKEQKNSKTGDLRTNTPEDEESPEEEKLDISKGEESPEEEVLDIPEDIYGGGYDITDSINDAEDQKEDADDSSFFSDDLEILCATDVILVGDSTLFLLKSGSAYIRSLGNSDLEWKSDNESIATVENGVVTGISSGSTIISVTHNGVTAKYNMQVTTVDNGQGVKVSADYRNVSITDGAGATIKLSFAGSMPTKFGAICYASGDIGTLSYHWGKVEGNSLDLTINSYGLTNEGEGNVRILIYPQDDPDHIIASEIIHVKVT